MSTTILRCLRTAESAAMREVAVRGQRRRAVRAHEAVLTGELATLTAQGADLDKAIATNLAAIGFTLPEAGKKTGKVKA